MKWVIAGTRTIEISFEQFCAALDLLGIKINRDSDTIIAGECSTGIDQSAKEFAGVADVSYKGYPADWNTHGKFAGPKRNQQMAKDGDALILIWDGESRGSNSMRREMIYLGKPIYEIVLRKHFT